MESQWRAWLVPQPDSYRFRYQLCPQLFFVTLGKLDNNLSSFFYLENRDLMSNLAPWFFSPSHPHHAFIFKSCFLSVIYSRDKCMLVLLFIFPARIQVLCELRI